MCMNLHKQDQTVGSIADFIEMFPAALPYIQLMDVLENHLSYEKSLFLKNSKYSRV